MAIADHAVSDRAISAPEDSVVVGVTVPGRVVVRDRAVGEVTVLDAVTGDAIASDSWAASVSVLTLAAGFADVSDAPTGAVTIESFPL